MCKEKETENSALQAENDKVVAKALKYKERNEELQEALKQHMAANEELQAKLQAVSKERAGNWTLLQSKETRTKMITFSRHDHRPGEARRAAEEEGAAAGGGDEAAGEVSVRAGVLAQGPHAAAVADQEAGAGAGQEGEDDTGADGGAAGGEEGAGADLRAVQQDEVVLLCFTLKIDRHDVL